MTGKYPARLHTKNFFGETSLQTSNVFTLMGNLMLGPKIGPFQPYGVIGLGLIRTSVEDTASGASTDNSQFGWDAGAIRGSGHQRTHR